MRYLITVQTDQRINRQNLHHKFTLKQWQTNGKMNKLIIPLKDQIPKKKQNMNLMINKDKYPKHQLHTTI